MTSCKRHVPTSTTEIVSWTLSRFSALNGSSPIIWRQIFQKLALYLYDLRVVTHISEMNRFLWLFSRTYLFLMKLSTYESIASRFRSRADDQVIREQEESRSRQKGGSYWRGYRYHARCPSAAIMTRIFSVSAILDDVVLVMSCADIDFVLKYLTIFVVTSAFYLLRHTLLSGSVVINDVGISSDAFFRRMTYIVLHSSWKRMLSPVKDLVRIFNVFSLRVTSLSSLVRKRA